MRPIDNQRDKVENTKQGVGANIFNYTIIESDVEDSTFLLIKYNYLDIEMKSCNM